MSADIGRPPSVAFSPRRDAVLAAVAVAAITVCSTIGLYRAARRVYVEEAREELLRRARVAAAFVDGDLHRTFVSPAQQEGAEYTRAVAPLRKMMASDPEIRFLYTVALVEDQPHFILDATPPGDADQDGVEDHSRIMDRYEDPDNDMLVALREGRAMVMREPQADQWGEVLSAYAPIRDRSGNLVGIVGVDLTAQRYADHLNAMRFAALMTLLPAAVLSILAGAFVFIHQRRRAEHVKEQEEARAAVEEALARFEDLVDNSPMVAVQGLDRQGTIRRWNRASTVLYGYRADEVIGQRIQDVVLAPEDVTAFDRVLDEIWTTGRPTTPREWPVRTRDGQVHWVYSTIVPVVSRGAVDEAYCMDVDISDRKRHETELAAYAAALEKSQAVAESATRAKSAFLASMSHEIRTPMTAILGFADVLLADRNVNGTLVEQAESLQAIRRNGEYLLELIDDILDLSKIEAEKLDIERIAFSPAHVLADVASLMKVRTDAKNLALSVEYAGPIPETIQSDPLRFRQILINLVGNAIKFTATGSVRLVGQVVPRPDRFPLLQVDVIDTGIGLTPQEISNLFQPFNQADSSTTRKYGGSGLGLVISRRLAAMLGGDIAIHSMPGQGSTFSVTVEAGDLAGVPLREMPPDTTAAAAPAFDATTADNVELNCRILLAEDGPDNRRLIAFLLEKAGAEVTVAENGQLAFDAARAAIAHGAPFDMVLMDMQMPVMDGYEATRQLRAEGYAGPIVALTAHAMTDDRQKCLDAGCDDYLTKPIHRARMLHTIASYLSSVQPRPTPTAAGCPGDDSQTARRR
ncbi:MAG: response regulator [Planctomycetes bacterium]|nr:response regulator [Planctomycetota bacterium]